MDDNGHNKDDTVSGYNEKMQRKDKNLQKVWLSGFPLSIKFWIMHAFSWYWEIILRHVSFASIALAILIITL